MNFAEVRFWQLLAGILGTALILRLLIARREPDLLPLYDKCALLGLGLLLLLAVSWITFLIFSIVAIGTYVGLAWIVKFHPQAKWRYVAILIPLQLAPLVYYKYAYFITDQVLGIRFDTLRGLIIPVGISFYTFQKIAYVIDTLVLRKPQPRFLDFMNFAAFFPQIVAGPIERRQNLLPQMEAFRFRWGVEDLNAGAGYIVVGLFFKCCLADNLATFFDPSSKTNPFAIWLANILFGLRIYYDFAGYSLIALGLARCLGVRLTLNFASPYCSTSIVEFWRRWHITLSQWFRDYVYVPLGGGRVRWWALNIAVVFIVSGIWHGAGWNFVLWGAVHGLFLIVTRLFSGKMKLPAIVGWAITMIVVFIAWLCFYETRTADLLTKLASLFTPGLYSGDALALAIRKWPAPELLTMAAVTSLAAGILVLEWLSVRKEDEPYLMLRNGVMLSILVILTVALAPSKNNAFIYFAF